MKIVFWGTPSYAVQSLNAIYNAGHEILAVVTQPDRKRRRGSELTFSPVKERAVELNVPIIQPIKIKEDKEIQLTLEKLEADIYIVVAFGQILPIEVLDQPKYGSWNSHASLLPKWRGAAPIQWSLLSGDKETGIGIMAMEEGLDTGGVLKEKRIEIDLLDNADMLANKLSKLSAELLVSTIEYLSTLKLDKGSSYTEIKGIRKQDSSMGITYARQINKKDNVINWNEECSIVHKQIMGLYPNAYTMWQGKRLKLMGSIPLDNSCNSLKDMQIMSLSKNYSDKIMIPGQVLAIEKDLGLVVGTKDYPILITRGQLPGKSESAGRSLIQQLKAKPNIDIFNNVM